MKSSEKMIADLTVVNKAVKYLLKETDEFPKEFTQKEINHLSDLIKRVHVFNPWFTEDMILKSFQGLTIMLDEEKLSSWINSYQINENKPKNVAVIMAGNIPMVGFHDLLSVLASGNNALVKMSRDDDKLLPGLVDLLFHLDESYRDRIQFMTKEFKGFDAVIATGSDNTSRYFEQYFKSYPNIIRKNRTSVAVIDKGVSDEELKILADDIFDYYGLGCRNVSKIFLPEGFDIDRFFKAIYHKHEIINHNKYANNYDYNRAIYLMNQEDILDNGFLLLKESKELFSPLGMLFYERYQDSTRVDEFIKSNEQKIQAVIGKGHIPFGEGQKPGLTDYADGIDVMKFLERLA